MKTRIMTTTLPVAVVGGMILLLGCGAESGKSSAGDNANSPEIVKVDVSTNSTSPVVPPEPLPGIAPAPPTLSPGVSEIVQLAKSGVGDEVLLAYIENASAPYKLNVEEILYLHDLGLSTPVIAAIVRHNESSLEGDAVANAPAAEPTTSTNRAATQAAVESASTNAPAPDETNTNAYAITPPTQQVNYNYFYQNLAPYGSWVDVPSYGWCWQPTVAVIDTGWRPYCDRGRWLWSDCGWYWQSDYSWGWAPFHYGRWCRAPSYGWVWAPGTAWGPAWVTWRYSGSYCGWAPLPPGAQFDAGIGFRFNGRHISAGFDFGFGPDYYTFVPTARFCDYTPWYYAVPSLRVVNIYNHTTIINNYGIGPNHRSVVNVGPGINAIANVSRGEIRKVTLHDLNATSGTLVKADRLEHDGKTLAVFRPNLPVQAVAPPAEIIRRQQESRKQSEQFAQTEVTRLSPLLNERRTPIASLPRRTATTEPALRRAPLSTPTAIGNVTTSRSPKVETGGTRLNEHEEIIGSSKKTWSPSVVTRGARTEPRNTVASSRPAAVHPPQPNQTPQPLAELSPRLSEPRAPVVNERSARFEPRAEFHPQPDSPAERPQSTFLPQVITPSSYRQESRTTEIPSFTAPNRSASTVIQPRTVEPRVFQPQYRPPQNYSPPPAVTPRSFQTPAARPSSPPRSYSPPPASVSRPQPAPAAPPSRSSRSDGGRKPN